MQREWQHSVPKVASAGPRIANALLHGRVRTTLEAIDSRRRTDD